MYLLKHIAQTGAYPSRLVEKLIVEKKISINGQLAKRSSKVKNGDVILIDGEPIKSKSKNIYLAFNKPLGITCTSEVEVENNIIDYINFPERIFPVGRLDKDSEGLILLTNDGEISNKILHSDNHHEKEYVVKVKEKISNRFLLAEMSSGVKILNTLTKPCTVEKIDDQTLRIILTQGLNRQVRKMCEAVGLEVTSLQRTRIMNIKLNALEIGKWRHLEKEELFELFHLLKVSQPKE